MTINRSAHSHLQPVPSAEVLSIRELGKVHYIDGKPFEVLHNVSLDVRQGSFTSIVGPSGCGKSSLLRLITGLDTEYSGSITLEGNPIRGVGPGRGIAFQEHRLFPWLNVEQNVRLALDTSDLSSAERDAAVEEHLGIVGLKGFERAYPSQLSGGMAQRAAIARALVNRPAVLLLDEPLGALDSLTRANLQNELLNIWRQEKVTVIMVTHDVEEAVFLSDKVVVMEARPGRIKAEVPITFPRPRNRTSHAFSQLKEKVFEHLR